MAAITIVNGYGETITTIEADDQWDAIQKLVANGADLREANLYGANLRGANLHGANLRKADLDGANLRGGNLREADLYGANPRGADLREANLYGANLRGANLYGANLYGANLYGANLREADLRGANLRGANLQGANLQGANLQGANLGEKLPHFQICPQEGSFIAYKATCEAVLTLEIQADALRTSSLVGRKCRASAVKVLAASFETDDGMYHSKHDRAFIYQIGEIASVGDFDADPRVECTTGIHFFMTKEEAQEYL